MWPSLLAAFSLGLIGSVHCVGMCGPLVLSLPVQRLGPGQRSLSVALYHTGRIAVYSLGGLLFGLLGRRVYLAGWQQGLSILLGTAILLYLILRHRPALSNSSATLLRRPAKSNAFAVLRLPAAFFSQLQKGMGRLWQSPARGKFLLMGMANGLLPCGMVYMAIAGALTSPTIIKGVGFMAFFGLGTLPMLLGLQVTGRMVSISFRQQIRKALPYLTACIAILLILRGLNLGIPFVSPALAARPGHVVSCH